MYTQFCMNICQWESCVQSGYCVCSQLIKKKTHPVGWGCRIRRLHLCRGIRPPNEATCWPWVATRQALGRIPDRWAVIDPAIEWSMTCNTPFWPLLGLTGGRIGPDSINRLVMSSPSIYVFYPDHTFKYALAASSQLLSVSC